MDDLGDGFTAMNWTDSDASGLIDDLVVELEPIPADVDLLPELPGLADTEEGNAPALADPSLSVPPALDEIDLTEGESNVTESGSDSSETEPGEVVDDGVHGNPEAWTLNWFFQQVDGYCGPAAVSQIVSQYTGVDITGPQQLVDRALELGLMTDPSEGMTLPNIEKLLEDQGVPATLTNSSLDDLRGKLDDGYGVLAMVDSGEIWNPDQEPDEDDTADHVLVVAGIDDTRGVVILSDPGTPGGNQLEIPIAQFEAAWADSGNQMLVTDTPDDALATAPTPAHPASGRGGRSAVIAL
ncbi:C39 family peptidase [Rhodococcus sp. Q]|uniref:C39 family peptidase n=1 Tax=Rhodococcus sp. Q TaxID=2502252 RepID=UPI00201624F0|nr:C39 family peptidase [Rhodococcus sp. Q]